MQKKSKTLVSDTYSKSDNELYEAEQNLYYYSSYYPCAQNKQGVLVYIKTDNRGLGYRHRNIFPGAISINTNRIDMNTAIIFNTNEQTINTGTIHLNTEFIHLINELAKALGFHPDTKETLHKKIRDYRITCVNQPNAPLPEFTEAETKLLINCFYENS